MSSRICPYGFCLIILAFLLFAGSTTAQNTGSPEPEYLPNVGPSESTFFCQTKVFEDYRKGTIEALDKPTEIDPYTPLQGQGSIFDGVQLVTLPPGTVTPPWQCTETNGCFDQTDMNPRGTTLLWIPDDVAPDAPRVLYVHGGSWYFGSPWTDGYPTFAAKLAKKLRMPVLAIDYKLAPVGHFDQIIRQVGLAVNYLAQHEPLDLLAGDLTTTNPPSAAPPLFIMGDSSGGGTVISALVAQASQAGLPGAGQAVLSGGVVYSPWVNLLSNSPTYLSNLYTVHEPGDYPLGDIGFGLGSVKKLVKENQANAQDYMGTGSLEDPVANPFFARSSWLQRLPPISFHVGQPEQLLSDSAILASEIARRGGSVEFHQYDGMWHVFPMYEDGCGSGEPLVLARSAYSATRTFLEGLASGRRLACSHTPCFYGHYEYPQGHDTAGHVSSFDRFGPDASDDADWSHPLTGQQEDHVE